MDGGYCYAQMSKVLSPCFYCRGIYVAGRCMDWELHSPSWGRSICNMKELGPLPSAELFFPMRCEVPTCESVSSCISLHSCLWIATRNSAKNTPKPVEDYSAPKPPWLPTALGIKPRLLTLPGPGSHGHIICLSGKCPSLHISQTTHWSLYPCCDGPDFRDLPLWGRTLHGAEWETELAKICPLGSV